MDWIQVTKYGPWVYYANMQAYYKKQGVSYNIFFCQVFYETTSIYCEGIEVHCYGF